MKKRYINLIAVIILSLSLFGAGYYLIGIDSSVKSQTNNEAAQILPDFSLSELSKYDGTDTSKPIYIGYEGRVYDVSAGRDYYQPGGTYHSLAGKDSTIELNQFGGDIIKQKYPVVGTLN